MLALDRTTGVTRWDVSVGRNTTAPAVLGEQIFLVYNDGEIRSYSAVDGSLQWKSKNVPRSGSAVALFNGLVYYTGRENDVIAIDATTAAEKLRFKTKRYCYTPLIAGEMLYVRCQDKKLYALWTASLTEVWSIQNEKVVPPPVIFAEGVMYSLGSDGFMHAFK
jgi:outer membrane protein assembly factor BamB